MTTMKMTIAKMMHRWRWWIFSLLFSPHNRTQLGPEWCLNLLLLFIISYYLFAYCASLRASLQMLITSLSLFQLGNYLSLFHLNSVVRSLNTHIWYTKANVERSTQRKEWRICFNPHQMRALIYKETNPKHTYFSPSLHDWLLKPS